MDSKLLTVALVVAGVLVGAGVVMAFSGDAKKKRKPRVETDDGGETDEAPKPEVKAPPKAPKAPAKKPENGGDE